MSDETIHYAETQFGFEYGAASVERVWSHKGACCIRVKTQRGLPIEIRVTPTGLLRVRVEGGELEYGRSGTRLEIEP